MNVEVFSSHDLTGELPTDRLQTEFQYLTAVTNLGLGTLRLVHEAGYPLKLNLVYKPDGRNTSPYHRNFWVPPGVTPKFSAALQQNGSYDVDLALPGIGTPSTPSMNAATYNLLMPPPGYNSVQLGFSALGRTFYRVENDDYAPSGGRRKPNLPLQLKPIVAMNAISEALLKLATGDIQSNGTHGLEVIHHEELP